MRRAWFWVRLEERTHGGKKRTGKVHYLQVLAEDVAAAIAEGDVRAFMTFFFATSAEPASFSPNDLAAGDGKAVPR